MFGIAPLYLKLIGFVAAVGIIYGGYSYVKGLQNKVSELKTEKVQLEDMNNTLTETIAETQRMNQIRDEVGSVSHDIRKENQRKKEQRDTTINQLVTDGKDREVGPLLKEFFNAQ